MENIVLPFQANGGIITYFFAGCRFFFFDYVESLDRRMSVTNCGISFASFATDFHERDGP